jgi:hypothetical protein
MEWERGDKAREKKKKTTGSFDVGISNITKMYQISWNLIGTGDEEYM